MNTLHLSNINMYVDDHLVNGSLYISNGKFSSATENTEKAQDMQGTSALPGLIDIHTHGAMGVDFNRIQESEFAPLMNYYLKNGVTSVFPTIITDAKVTMLKQVSLISKMMKQYPQIKGIHLEGPFLSCQYKGAMPEKYLLLPDANLLTELQEQAQGAIKIITLAPELPGTAVLIQKALSLDIKVSLGHSNATFDETMLAIDQGASGATHIFNAMRLFHQHEAAIMGAVLMSNNVYCEAICDFKHLHEQPFNFLVQVKGKQKINLITDSIMAAGLGDGDYWLGVNQVTVANGDAKISGTDIRAGSILSAFQAVKNAAQCLSISLMESAAMMTSNPAHFLEIQTIGSFSPGSDADLITLDKNNQIETVYLQGTPHSVKNFA